MQKLRAFILLVACAADFHPGLVGQTRRMRPRVQTGIRKFTTRTIITRHGVPCPICHLKLGTHVLHSLERAVGVFQDGRSTAKFAASSRCLYSSSDVNPDIHTRVCVCDKSTKACCQRWLISKLFRRYVINFDATILIS